MKKKPLRVDATPERVERARHLRSIGMNWRQIADEMQISPEAARCWGDPEYGARRKAQHEARNVKLKARCKADKARDLHPSRNDPPVPKMPRVEDNRDICARLMGDPLPGRSALDRRRGA